MSTLPSPAVLGRGISITSGELTLAGYLVSPSATAARRPGLVLCHGFPLSPSQQAGHPGRGYIDLADRIAADTGWHVLTFSFRGTGRSEGNFSVAGWLSDLEAAAAHLGGVPGVDGVWLCGFAAGGALALCVAGEDPEIRGVAAMSAPADFSDRASDARRFVAQARQVGAIRDKEFPPDLDAWARELREVRPLSMIGKIPPRPILLVHGAADEVVPLIDARALADAAEGHVQLKVLAGAGHRLRHDPRAVAMLLGWIDRQS
jgi:pimeloyl-ACP methyl ester carboxylesterase